ncbi:putative Bifunctional methylthioribulose-1-phosphate dehydratase/enolase-phosphatase E1 2 [Hibiscus syriacus]|uniref:Bifunctional methylthioribulose-1-phosphate dehydratase/enolase-phosphatase E1 2 n=1 Tax=Hibiscus syriacus TaxID=106335 RepID=A0A6A3ACY9_HIBSY|nr:O-acyltransferase WSD1-like [Hibiscus syriacus]KAE8702384.1 putative Bifunctional methylthioribulose-1-phosphate dehydratase/enolase-phosphatase E1 2 [Hibiscus syriacus]
MVKYLNVEEDTEYSEPVSPTGQYFNSSVLSICVLAVLDSEIPIDDSPTLSLLRDVFLPINHRFSSIMVNDENGVKQWKKVEVKLEEHVNIPVFPPGLSPESYDTHLSDYLSKIAMEQLQHNRPLWNIHIIKYPTSNAAGNLIFKLHHSLGDGYSLMGALLSCLQRAENPNVPLTFPSLTSAPTTKLSVENNSFLRNVPNVLWSAFNTVSDFGWSLLKSTYVEDDKSMIRSGVTGVELKPVVVSTMTFSLHHIKQIKNKLGVTINDVITGIIFLGTRLYMQGTVGGSNKLNNEHTTALVLLNTRVIGGYKSVKEMVKPDAESAWGNQFGFLHVSLPELSSAESCQPLDFVWKAQKLIQRKRNSSAVFLTGLLLECLRKYTGPEATAKYIHSTLKNSSMTISNVIGPVEKMALADHPVKGLYFMVVGVPQSLTITMMSYMGKLSVAVGAEKGYLDPIKFKSAIETAFGMILDASQEIA